MAPQWFLDKHYSVTTNTLPNAPLEQEGQEEEEKEKKEEKEQEEGQEIFENKIPGKEEHVEEGYVEIIPREQGNPEDQEKVKFQKGIAKKKKKRNKKNQILLNNY